MQKFLCQNYLAILKSELVVALGCTEPIAIAYAAAKARRLLGTMPERCTVHCNRADGARRNEGDRQRNSQHHAGELIPLPRISRKFKTAPATQAVLTPGHPASPGRFSGFQADISKLPFNLCVPS